VVILVSAALAVASPLCAQNMVTNATFDLDVSGWTDDLGPGIEVLHNGSNGSHLPGGSGSGCLQLRSTTHNGGPHGTTQRLAVTAGESYFLAGSYYMPRGTNFANGATLGVIWLKNDGFQSTITWVGPFNLEYETWVRLEGTVVAPADAVEALVGVFVNSPSDDTEPAPVAEAQFDDLYFGVLGASIGQQELYVAAAAAAAGNLGTYWSTDLYVRCLVARPLELKAAFLAQGTDNTAAVDAPVKIGTVPPEGTLKISDVVSALGASGTGGLYLIGEVHETGLPAELMVATTRTFTPNPYGDGGYGQGIPALGPGNPFIFDIPGLNQGADFRTNIGVLNTSDREIQVQIWVRDGTGAVKANVTWTLQPFEQRQQSLPSLGVTSLQDGSVRFQRLTGTGSYRAFTSVVDNASGDAMYNGGM
jgi:hypothetical protein